MSGKKTATGFNEALLVRYRNLPIMVGKIFPVRGSLIFLHEQSGTQKHWQTDCTSPVDVGVIDYLREIGVLVVHATRQRSKMLLVATPDLIASKGQRLGYDGRDRYYLPDAYWEKAERDYDILFCPREHVIECELFRLPPFRPILCSICGRPMSSARAGDQCGGFDASRHAGVTVNGITCRFFDPEYNPPASNWKEVSKANTIKKVGRR